jgi:Flp pilus assembly pilin Flp
MRAKSFFRHPSLMLRFMRLNHDECGQGMVEYVLILMLIALALIGAVPPIANALIRLINGIVAAFGGGS